jgi:hypothetical protein
MKTLQVNGVAKIAKDSKGNTLNVFVLKIAGGKPAILRSASEFLTDLKNAFLIGDNVRNANHPELLSVLRDLNSAPFTISGEIIHAIKGEKWTVRETSSVITNPNHPKHGSVAIGDELPYERDMTIVTDGFLQVVPNDKVTMMNKQAFSYGNAMASMLGQYEDAPVETTNEGETVDPDLIPDDVLSEATDTK